MNQATLLPNAAPSAPEALHTDRRRRGRTNVRAELIPLLRAIEAQAIISDERDWSTLDHEDAMAPARGLAIGLLLAIPFWAIIGSGGYFIFR